jgi:excisionase family DNA binding protein
MRKKRMLTEEEKEKIRGLLNQGLSLREIAKRLGVSKGAVEYYSRKEEVLTLKDIETYLDEIKDLLIEINNKLENLLIGVSYESLKTVEEEKVSNEVVSQDKIKTEEVLTVKEVSELLKTSERTVQYWCKNGKIKAMRIGKKWLIPASEIEKVRGLKDAI